MPTGAPSPRDERDRPPSGSRTEPLRRDEALRLLREHAPEVERRYGVRLVALFGSVARDEARVDSDVDVLVEYVRPPGLREFLGAIDYLEQLFDARVDMGTLQRLKPRVQPFVRRDMVRVA